MKYDISKSNPHEGYFQRGKYIDIMFADNINTDMYWENNTFPMRVEDWGGFLFHCADYLFNWQTDGIRFEDCNLILITKNGQFISSDHFESYKDFMSAIKPFTEKHFAAAIFNEIGYEYFWFNGWDGLMALQENTGWFDLDIYGDWI